MEKIVKLQKLIQSQEHFEILDELGYKLEASGRAIRAFVGTTDIIGHRDNFKWLLGYSQLLIGLCKMKLSVSEDEILEVEAKAIDLLLKQYAPEEPVEVDFSLEDF